MSTDLFHLALKPDNFYGYGCLTCKSGKRGIWKIYNGFNFHPLHVLLSVIVGVETISGQHKFIEKKSWIDRTSRPGKGL